MNEKQVKHKCQAVLFIDQGHSAGQPFKLCEVQKDVLVIENMQPGDKSRIQLPFSSGNCRTCLFTSLTLRCMYCVSRGLVLSQFACLLRCILKGRYQHESSSSMLICKSEVTPLKQQSYTGVSGTGMRALNVSMVVLALHMCMRQAMGSSSLFSAEWIHELLLKVSDQ